ncbi:MAG TPA: AAA family ATPase [Vicinamibacterales bacterium]|nr:AAA family ATPase [Vicinamibacterales bacterium]
MTAECPASTPPFRLDPADERVYCGDREITLRPKTFQVLRYLVEHAGVLVTKDELLDAVWPGVHVGEGVLKGCVREIRRALDDCAGAPRFIATVHGRGYRFIAPMARPGSPILETPAAAPTVGRASELARLRSLFERACAGQPQVVFVSGEPGIGKTTLVQAFAREIAGAAAAHVGQGECLQHHGICEAYLPVLQALTRLCRGSDGARVAAVLRQCAPTWLAQIPAFVDRRELDALRRQSLGAGAQRMLREIGEAIDALTGQRPLLLVLEDLHWSDFSTLDLVSFLARHPAGSRFMVLATYRPSEVASQHHPLNAVRRELLMHRRCTEIALEGLNARDVQDYLDARFPRNRFSRDLAAVLHARTEGHPLFMVALTDDLVARGIVRPARDGWELCEAPAALAVTVPDTVRQMIESQLAHVEPADRGLLQVAAVLGLEFSSAALALAADADPLHVEERCDALARRLLFLTRLEAEELPDGGVSTRYRFLHAVHRTVLYEQVPVARRIEFHRRAGEALETLHREAAADLAAELALHFERGRDWPRAAAACLQAARNAVRRFAYHEAIQLAKRGLEAVERLPESDARKRQELLLLTVLGPALITAKTYTAPEVQQVYARARELCEQVGETPEIFPILWGLVRFYLVGSPVTTARALAEEMLHLAERAGDPDVLIHAHDSVGATCADSGDFATAREQYEACRRLYDPDRHGAHVFQYAQDPGVACRVRGAIALWCLGYPDQAFARSAEGLALARRLAHPFSETFALAFGALLHELARNWPQALELADAVLASSARNSFQAFPLLGGLIRAGVHAVVEPSAAAATAVGDVLRAARDVGILLYYVYGQGLEARAWMLAGRPDRALGTVQEALRLADVTGERFYEAELHRLSGDIHLRLEGPDARSQAVACYQRSLDAARRQHARSWELRTALSLAALHRAEGEPALARRIVTDALSCFTEGFDTPDLRDARAAVQEPAPPA